MAHIILHLSSSSRIEKYSHWRYSKIPLFDVELSERKKVHFLLFEIVHQREKTDPLISIFPKNIR